MAYLAIKETQEETGCSIAQLCRFAEISRSAYYKWTTKKNSQNQLLNHQLLTLIPQLYESKKGILGYRQMTMKLNREYKLQVNEKRIYRLMKLLGLKSVCRKKKKNYKRTSPFMIAENVLNREFQARRFGEKWLTDITEMKYGKAEKAYLSAILDLTDRSIVSFCMSKTNNLALVRETIDQAHKCYPDAKPLLHSDRGHQYTSKKMKKRLDEIGIRQSMSRVGHCIDNGPMECFWGILKSEMYYIEKFQSYEELEQKVKKYIYYYNNERYQKGLKSMTPMEYRKQMGNI